MNKTKADYIWAVLMSVVKIVLQIVAIIVLGRILSPSDFGLIGMISIFISLSNMLVDSGMGASILRKHNVEEIEYSTLFLYNLFISLFIYIVLFISSPYIAAFYDQNQLILIIRILSLNIIINAISRCQYTMMLKNFKYKELSLITIVSNLLAIIIAIIVALSGGGVWSLVALQIFEMFFTTLLSVWTNRYIPSLKFSKKYFKEQFFFGINLFSATTLNTIGENIQSNIIAKFMPLSVTGCFVQAQRMQHVPSLIIRSVLDKVMFPKLAILDDKNDFQDSFYKTIQIVSLLSIMLSFYVNLISPDIIPLLLGDKWIMAGHILSLLIFVIIPDGLKSSCRNVLKALGNSSQILVNECCFFVLVLFAIFFSYSSGIIFMIYAIIIAYIITSVIILFITNKYLPNIIFKVLKIYVNSLLINMMFYMIVYCIQHYVLVDTSVYLKLIIITLFYVFLFLLNKKFILNK